MSPLVVGLLPIFLNVFLIERMLSLSRSHSALYLLPDIIPLCYYAQTLNMITSFSLVITVTIYLYECAHICKYNLLSQFSFAVCVYIILEYVPHPESLSLQQLEIITESHTWTQCGDQLTMEIPAPTDTSTSQLLHLLPKECHKRGSKKIVRARISGHH